MRLLMSVALTLLLVAGCSGGPDYQGRNASEWAKDLADLDEGVRDRATDALLTLTPQYPRAMSLLIDETAKQGLTSDAFRGIGSKMCVSSGDLPTGEFPSKDLVQVLMAYVVDGQCPEDVMYGEDVVSSPCGAALGVLNGMADEDCGGGLTADLGAAILNGQTSASVVDVYRRALHSSKKSGVSREIACNVGVALLRSPSEEGRLTALGLLSDCCRDQQCTEEPFRGAVELLFTLLADDSRSIEEHQKALRVLARTKGLSDELTAHRDTAHRTFVARLESSLDTDDVDQLYRVGNQVGFYSDIAVDKKAITKLALQLLAGPRSARDEGMPMIHLNALSALGRVCDDKEFVAQAWRRVLAEEPDPQIKRIIRRSRPSLQ